MNNPLEVSFRGIPQSQLVESVIQEKFEKVKRINKDIIKCHVVMEKLSNHHQKGNAYCVRLDLRLPHFSDIVVSEDSKEGEVLLASAVRETFKKAQSLMREQLERHIKKIQPHGQKEILALESSEELEDR